MKRQLLASERLDWIDIAKRIGITTVVMAYVMETHTYAVINKTRTESSKMSSLLCHYHRRFAFIEISSHTPRIRVLLRPFFCDPF